MTTLPVARINDTYQGIFVPPSPATPVWVVGQFIGGALNVTNGGLGVVRVTDLGQSNNPYFPVNSAFTGGINTAGGLQIHRLTDKVDIGAGQLGDTVSGSPNLQSK